ncbi:MAG: hypothetical protein RBU37_22960, partial [Myxococcota bacterium]|nr:hypothetical protein [Myxococcota bacterium]
MKRKQAIQFTLVAWASTLLLILPSQVWADAAMSNSIPPVIMILFDTSGSMEWLPTSNTTIGSCVRTPCCEGSWPSYRRSNRTYGKSRTIIAKEVMTGTFKTDQYYCAQRTAGGASYWDVPSSVEQNPDGVLQRYQSMVKFGIAGYD